MTTYSKSAHSSRAWILLFMALAACTATAQTDAPGNGVKLVDDLRTVIILEGYPCKRVSHISQTNQSEYHVSCEMGRQYLVKVSEEKELVVENRSEPSKVASQTDTEHEAFMKKQLFAIVNLAGHDCGGVVRYERHGRKGNIVTCQNQTLFRIYVTPEGRVAVEKQQVNK